MYIIAFILGYIISNMMNDKLVEGSNVGEHGAVCDTDFSCDWDEDTSCQYRRTTAQIAHSTPKIKCDGTYLASTDEVSSTKNQVGTQNSCGCYWTSENPVDWPQELVDCIDNDKSKKGNKLKTCYETLYRS